MLAAKDPCYRNVAFGNGWLRGAAMLTSVGPGGDFWNVPSVRGLLLLHTCSFGYAVEGDQWRGKLCSFTVANFMKDYDGWYWGGQLAREWLS